jgi:hypothetical protein
MTLLLNLLAELAGLTAVVGIALATLLVLRNPHNPRWMKSDFAAQMASVVLVTLIAGILAWAMAGMIDAGLRIASAALLTAATVGGFGWLLWTTLRVGEGLKCADAGRSPFEAFERDPRPRKPKTSAR